MCFSKKQILKGFQILNIQKTFSLKQGRPKIKITSKNTFVQESQFVTFSKKGNSPIVTTSVYITPKYVMNFLLTDSQANLTKDLKVLNEKQKFKP